ncbi:nucleoside/nucleotide kinase family protein (plasmid) [Qingshengfaniella alkalisoli]|uniref:Nucleoside/nucleotide kinase family protein n=1 Tax=Qingshengfaniella alkalisoli TaxID=2599296 RepID=A0A5B8J8V5_9RHOB|nr:nucleoside/nucleotide kinase family protein [Qingshengfaniella alkalisoli]
MFQFAHRLLLHADRQFLAIAGAPGSGKSTSAELIQKRLEQLAPKQSALLPMDGFHYDDDVLRSLGRYERKGASDTFDVGGLRATLQRLRARDEPDVAVPVFCRDRELSRGSARLIPAEVQVIIVEGNYLLLDQNPWSSLQPFFDLTCMIDVDEPELSQRLYARWQGYGLNDAQIRQKLDGNDLPNVAVVRDHSVPADLVFKQ